MNRIIFTLSILILFPIISFSQKWDIETKLVASDREEDSGFGHAVARTNDLAVVTAIYEDRDENGANPIGGAGAAYIFQKQANGTWLEVQKIVASDRQSSDRFGVSCAILGNTLFIGAEENDYDTAVDNQMDKAGAVFVFEKGANNLWEQTQKIVAPDRFQQSYFGCSVDAFGNYLVIGARGDRTDADGENPITNCGSAYVYKKGINNLWALNKKLTPITRRFYEQFGCDVAIHEKRIVIGAYRDGVSSTYPDRGAAYVFELDLDDEWMPIQKITPTVRSAEKFGWAVDLNKDIIVVGAFENSAGATQVYYQTGAAYAFQKDITTGEWVQMTKFVKSNPTQNDHFGYDVAIHNSYLVIGARRTNISRGSVYIFNINSSGKWTSLQSSETSNAEGGDYFGTSVAIMNGQIIAGAPGEDHDLDEKNKLDASGSAFFIETKSVLSATLQEEADIKLFPNPSRGQFTLNSDLPLQNASIQIKDIKGKVLYEQPVKNEELLKLNFSSGIYYLHLYNDKVSLGVSKLIILNN